MNDIDNLMTRDEVAKKLRISVDTLDRHCKAGRLTSLKIGKRVLFRRDDVAALTQRAAKREVV